ncbi:MAG: choice-of-anchor E domain-containing protein [Phycisphaerales bacterium]|nr:choice-of-anchor E domain-containing protein [Phycisphaerales bacterium]
MGRGIAVIAGIGLALTSASAPAGLVEESQTLPFAFPLAPGSAALVFDQFDDIGGSRELRRVTIDFDGEINARVTAENDSPLPAPEFALNIAGLYTVEARDLAILVGLSEVFVTDGSVGPSDGIPGSGRDFWDFGLVAAGGTGSDETDTDLDAFIGDGSIVADVNANGGFSVLGSTDSTIITMDFTGEGTVTITYAFEEIPTGACCLPSGACVEVIQTRCEMAADLTDPLDPDGLIGNGTYQGDGTTCDAVMCPQPGACCLPDDTCVPAHETGGGDCTDRGGRYQGDDIPCAIVDCAGPMGACCLPDGSCLLVNQKVCAILGGLYQGTGTSCEAAECPQPKGACCFVSGTCGVFTERVCIGLGGTFVGDGVPCAAVRCPPPFGACCFSDGACEMMEIAPCVDAGGLFQGAGTSCRTAECPAAQGACCLPDGTCVFRTEDACDAAGGDYQGDWTDCGMPCK